MTSRCVKIHSVISKIYFISDIYRILSFCRSKNYNRFFYELEENILGRFKYKNKIYGHLLVSGIQKKL